MTTLNRRDEGCLVSTPCMDTSMEYDCDDFLDIEERNCPKVVTPSFASTRQVPKVPKVNESNMTFFEKSI